MIPRALLLTLALLLCPAAGASAGVLREEQEGCSKLGREFTCLTAFTFTAAPGEANRLTVTQVGDRTELRDAGAPLTETASLCEPLPGGGASCLNPIAVIRLETGDGDDQVLATGPVRPLVDGGPGSDELTGSDGPDDLDGGPGADVVRGGAGDDQLQGGGDDALDGGPGRDEVTYAGRRDPVRVDLAAGVAGTDRLTGIEDATGGDGADVLLGDSGPNELDAGSRDLLDGRGGADRLTVRGGPARLVGGPGDDELSLVEGTVTADCGLGRDRVLSPGGKDVISRSCEVVSGTLGFEVRLSPTAVAVRAPGGQPAVAVLRTLGGRDLGRRVLGLGPPRVIPLNAAGRALARRPGSAPVRLRAERTGRSAGSIAFRLGL